MKTEAGQELRVLLVDDDPTVRHGLKLILRSEPGVAVVGEAADGEDAVAQAERLEPDLVLMDLRMPGLDGLGATRRMKAAQPELRIVILSVYADQVDAALAAGASNFLLKDSPVERLLEVVHNSSSLHKDSEEPYTEDDEDDLGVSETPQRSSKGEVQ